MVKCDLCPSTNSLQFIRVKIYGEIVEALLCHNCIEMMEELLEAGLEVEDHQDERS